MQKRAMLTLQGKLCFHKIHSASYIVGVYFKNHLKHSNTSNINIPSCMHNIKNTNTFFCQMRYPVWFVFFASGLNVNIYKIDRLHWEKI